MISPRRLIFGLLFGVVLVASLTVTFAQSFTQSSSTLEVRQGSPFETTLPAEVAGKTDLWVAKLDPCPTDPEGAVYMVQRRFLGNYAQGRVNGYPWSWAPLKDVLRVLDGGLIATAPDPKTAQELARVRAAVASALSTLSSVSQ